MNLDNLLKSIYLIQPEMVLTGFISLLLLVYLIKPKLINTVRIIALVGVVVSALIVLINFQSAGPLLTYSQKVILAVDPLGNFFKLSILLATLLVFLFSIQSDELKQSKSIYGEYYILLMGMALGMMFFISASDFILLYLAMEMMSFTSYVLAGYLKQDLRSSEASLKYIIFGAASSGVMLFGISLLYGLTGSTNYYDIATLFTKNAPSLPILTLAVLMIFTGLGYKLSAVPFHYWMPDVFEGAPITITAYLSVASKGAGLAALLRLLMVVFGTVSANSLTYNWQMSNIIDWQAFFMLISIATMTLGNFAALNQDNLKRMLAYSGIAHIGYMLATLTVMGNQALFPIMFYFFVYLLTNLGAFYVVILIKNKTGGDDFKSYKGLGFKLPVLGVAMTIFMVSLTGLPPTAGFVGKLNLFLALFDSKLYLLALIALLNSVVSLYFYMKVLRVLYFEKSDSDYELKTTKVENIFAVVLTIPILLFGIYFGPLVNLIKSCTTIFVK